jgi:hypothetical protein
MFKSRNVRNVLVSSTSMLILAWAAGFWAAESCAAQDLDLKLRLKPQQTYNVLIVRGDTISQTVMGQRQDIHHTKTTGLEFEVERIDTDGVAWLWATYLTFKEKSESEAGRMEYDSTKPDAVADNPLAPTYAALIGQSLVMKVTPVGQVEIKGIDEMYRQMAERIIEAEDALRKKRLKEKAQRAIERANRQYGSRAKRIDAVKKMIKNNPLFAEVTITETVGHAIMPFPARAVGIGDSWQGKTTLVSSMPVKLDCTYTLKEKSQALATVEISSKIDLDDVPASAKEDSSGSIRMSMAGSYQGTAQIDRASGWMVRKRVAIKASGHVKIATDKQTPQGMTMPMSIESVITVEPLTPSGARLP